MMNWEEKANELHKAANRVSYLETIYNHVKEQMKWNSMEWHDADEEHEGVWHTAPEEDSYHYGEYLVYQEVLQAIEKLAK